MVVHSMVNVFISGGQTGIDRMGLEVAREPGLLTGGTAPKATVEFCQKENKPYLINPSADELTAFIRDIPFGILNVAGNRTSKLTSDPPRRHSLPSPPCSLTANPCQFSSLFEPSAWTNRFSADSLDNLGRRLALDRFRIRVLGVFQRACIAAVRGYPGEFGKRGLYASGQNRFFCIEGCRDI
jgi:hypothetical protein